MAGSSDDRHTWRGRGEGWREVGGKERERPLLVVLQQTVEAFESQVILSLDGLPPLLLYQAGHHARQHRQVRLHLAQGAEVARFVLLRYGRGVGGANDTGGGEE